MGPKPAFSRSEKSLLIILLGAICLVLGELGLLYYWRSAQNHLPQGSSPAKQTSPPKKPSIPNQGDFVAIANIDLYLAPNGKKVGYLIPGQEAIIAGGKENGFFQITDGEKKYLLWIEEKNFGQLVPKDLSIPK